MRVRCRPATTDSHLTLTFGNVRQELGARLKMSDTCCVSDDNVGHRAIMTSLPVFRWRVVFQLTGNRPICRHDGNSQPMFPASGGIVSKMGMSDTINRDGFFEGWVRATRPPWSIGRVPAAERDGRLQFSSARRTR